MRTAVRVLAALTATFQLVVGLAALVAPLVAAGAFGLPTELPPAVVAVLRMFGGLLASVGMLSATFAFDPDRTGPWARVLAAMLLLNVAADLLVVAEGELTFGQVGAGLVLEALFAGVLVARPAPGGRVAA